MEKTCGMEAKGPGAGESGDVEGKKAASKVARENKVPMEEGGVHSDNKRSSPKGRGGGRRRNKSEDTEADGQ